MCSRRHDTVATSFLGAWSEARATRIASPPTATLTARPPRQHAKECFLRCQPAASDANHPQARCSLAEPLPPRHLPCCHLASCPRISGWLPTASVEDRMLDARSVSLQNCSTAHRGRRTCPESGQLLGQTCSNRPIRLPIFLHENCTWGQNGGQALHQRSKRLEGVRKTLLEGLVGMLASPSSRDCCAGVFRQMPQRTVHTHAASTSHCQRHQTTHGKSALPLSPQAGSLEGPWMSPMSLQTVHARPPG